MSPENAKVFLAEEYPQMRKMAREIIEDAGHQVVAEIAGIDDLPLAFERAKEKGVTVAVVDENLFEDDTDDTSESDGRLIAELLRRVIPGIKIISFSEQNQDFGDIHVDKNDTDQVLKLGHIIREI